MFDCAWQWQEIGPQVAALSTEATLVAGTNGAVFWVNAALLTLTGHTEPAQLQDLFHPPSGAVIPNLIQVAASGTRTATDLLLASPNGAPPRPVKATLQPIGPAEGPPVAIACFLTPLPDREAQDCRFRDLVECTSDWIWEVDAHLRYTYSSPKCLDLLGYKPEEMIGRQPWDFMPPSEVQRLQETANQLLVDPKPFRGLQNTNLHRDGSLRVLETSGVPIYDAAGRFVGFRGIDRDITAASRASEARKLQLFLELSPAPIWRLDLHPPIDAALPADGIAAGIRTAARMAICNAPAARLLGVEQSEQITGRGLDQLPSSWLPALLEEFARRPGNRLVEYEHPAGSAGGQPQVAVSNVLPIFEDGRLVSIWGSARNETERHYARQRLWESETRYRLLINQAHFPAIVSSLTDDEILFANDRACAYFGIATNQTPGMKTAAICPNPAAHNLMIDTLRETGSINHAEVEILARGGIRRWVSISSSVVKYSGQLAAFSIFSDITERRTAQAALRASEQRYSDVVLSIADAVYELDADFRITYISDRITALLGYTPEEMIGSTPDRFFDPQEARQTAETMTRHFHSHEKFSDADVWHRTRDGRRVCLRVSGIPNFDEHGHFLSSRGLLRDITAQMKERESQARITERLRQSNKLESLGRLAGGVAHDFNNLLTVINGYAQLLLTRLAPGDAMNLPLTEIRKAGDLAASLTQQLLAFSRKQVIQPETIDLNQLITGSKNLLARLIGEDIELVTNLSAEVGRVLADRGQMNQVLINLAANARDAMPSGGRLVIETTDVQIGPETGARTSGMRPGAYVLLVVSDTGQGMEPEVREHVFEPFFTTKQPGRGTGLGLPAVYGIVNQCGGHLSLESQPGVGTTFRVYLPHAQVPGPVTAAPPAPLPPVRGSEVVLVVEDQDAVRKLVASVLRDFGYQVLSAESGMEALELAAAHSGPIHLLLTDIVMPRMNGRELAQRLKFSRPKMRVLYVSGYAENIISHRGILDPDVDYLRKPFSPEVLASRVRAALSTPHAPGRVLIADDNPGVRRLFELILTAEGYKVALAGDGQEVLTRLQSESFDLVITDLVMPNREGIETIRVIRQEHPEMKIIAVSGAFGGRLLKAASMLGADITLLKPVSPEELIGAVRRLID